ncbi:hypothetical protein NMY22_g15048 [Coprinellus aureogranulatus]|nr:hypothetical protein NMY22_g15048 [Coprinellus aureogranulatus]
MALQEPLTLKDRKVLGIRANKPLMEFSMERFKRRVGRFQRHERIQRYLSQLPVEPEEFEHMDEPDLIELFPLSETSVDPTETGEGSSSCSEATSHDLSSIDWTSQEASLTEEEKKALGDKFKYPRPLLQFCVNTLAMPSMYEKGETKRTNVVKWLARVPVSTAEFVRMEMARTISSVYA